MDIATSLPLAYPNAHPIEQRPLAFGKLFKSGFVQYSGPLNGLRTYKYSMMSNDHFSRDNCVRESASRYQYERQLSLKKNDHLGKHSKEK